MCGTTISWFEDYYSPQRQLCYDMTAPGMQHRVDQRPGKERFRGYQGGALDLLSLHGSEWPTTYMFFLRYGSGDLKSICLGRHRVKYRYIVVPSYELDELSNFHLSTKPFAVVTTSKCILLGLPTPKKPQLGIIWVSTAMLPTV